MQKLRGLHREILAKSKCNECSSWRSTQTTWSIDSEKEHASHFAQKHAISFNPLASNFEIVE